MPPRCFTRYRYFVISLGFDNLQSKYEDVLSRQPPRGVPSRNNISWKLCLGNGKEWSPTDCLQEG